METDADKQKAIKTLLAKINKDFGDGAIMTLGEFGETEIDCISTGCVGLDIALGGKGMPRGRIVEIIGHESSSKTTITLHLCHTVQKAGGSVAFIDVEHALDPEWAKRIGVDVTKMYISQPSNGEEALQIAELLVSSGYFDLVIVDSVAALVPKKELDNEIGEPTMGLQARLMSQALRVLNPAVSKSNTCLVFINQYRQKIGVMYGSPDVGTGGLALKFYASIRLETRAISEVVKGEDDAVIAKGMKAKVLKNKIAPPFRVAEFFVRYDRGIDTTADLLDHAVKYGIIAKSGTFYSYKDRRLGQGKENTIDFIRGDDKLTTEIFDKVIEISKTSKTPVEEEV